MLSASGKEDLSYTCRSPYGMKIGNGVTWRDGVLLDEVCAAFDLQPRGSAGEHSAAEGAKFDVSNKQRLGFTEVELVQKMIDGVTRVIALEEKLASGQKLVKGTDY